MHGFYFSINSTVIEIKSCHFESAFQQYITGNCFILCGKMNAKQIILFDGVCNLCNGAVNFVIKRDKSSLIKFAALQSEPGQRLLEQYHLSTGIFNSFVLIESGMVYTRSTAALKVCKNLTFFWPIMYGFIIVPKFI